MENGSVAESMEIICGFEDLTEDDRGAFAEYLSYVVGNSGEPKPVLQIHWIAKRQKKEGSGRRFQTTEWRTGIGGKGPSLDMNARALRPQRTYARYATQNEHFVPEEVQGSRKYCSTLKRSGRMDSSWIQYSILPRKQRI